MQKSTLAKLSNAIFDMFKKLVKPFGWFCICLSLFLILISLLSREIGAVVVAIVISSPVLLTGIYFVWKKEKIITNLTKMSQIRERQARTADQFIEKKLGEVKEKSKQRNDLQNEIESTTGGNSIKVVAIGGKGWEFITNKKLIAGLGKDGLHLWDKETLKSYTVSREAITEINVGGPGTVRSGGGVMGGGFGLDGFLVGAAAATVLNILTSHKTTKTLVHVKCDDSEIFLLISTMEPDEARIFLSPLFVSLKTNSNSYKNTGEIKGIAEEIEKLAKLLADGHITKEEYTNLKARVLNPHEGVAQPGV